MMSRRRTLVALMLELSFALALAEGVWASTCPPGMPMDMDSAAVEATADVGSVASDSMSDMADVPAPTDRSDEDDSNAPADCPFGLPGTTGSCASVAAMLALRFEDLLAPSGNALPALSHHQMSGNLLTSGLFHPPKP